MRSLDSILVGCVSSTLILILILILALFLVIFCCSNDGTRKNNGRSPWIEFVSWGPRAFICHNFLSEKECLKLIKLAKPHMRRSVLFDTKLRKNIENSSRTSTTMILNTRHDRLTRRIEKRIAEFTFIPIEKGGSLYILHYEVGQKFDAHYDYAKDECTIKERGQTIVTFLMYLSDVEEGGETVFPAANKCASSARWWKKLPIYGKDGLSIKPKMGDALLFWSMKPDGTLDHTTLHGSNPVIRGDKWACVKLMRTLDTKFN